MESDGTAPRAKKAHTGVIGTLIVAWWLLDALIAGLTVIVLAAWLEPLVVFVVAAIVLTVINVACCTWIDHHWDRWMSGRSGRTLEKKLAKWRTSGVMKHPVSWVTRGSDVWFGLAAMLTNAIGAIGIARLIGGQPIGERRILVAAASYSIFFAALFSLIGFAAGDAIRAV